MHEWELPHVARSLVIDPGIDWHAPVEQAARKPLETLRANQVEADSTLRRGVGCDQIVGAHRPRSAMRGRPRPPSAGREPSGQSAHMTRTRPTRRGVSVRAAANRRASRSVRNVTVSA